MSGKTDAAARQLAKRLAERFREDDWPARLAAYSAGCQAIVEKLGDSRQGRRLMRSYAAAVVEAFGTPPITCSEMMAIYASSDNAEHRAQAEAWLASQGGEITMRRADGESARVRLPPDAVDRGYRLNFRQSLLLALLAEEDGTPITRALTGFAGELARLYGESALIGELEQPLRRQDQADIKLEVFASWLKGRLTPCDDVAAAAVAAAEKRCAAVAAVALESFKNFARADDR
jgi:hypothetical protein